jgi:hypothetical protein
LRKASENRSIPRLVTKKWLPKNEKLIIRLKNKTWTYEVKNHYNSNKIRLIRPLRHNTKIQNMCLKFLTPLTHVGIKL